MCNLYNLKVTRDELRDYFQASDDWRRQVSMTKDYAAPGKPGMVVRAENDTRLLGAMVWGVPHLGKPVTNVRNLDSAFWRSMLASPPQRCLVPVTEFQEWSVEPHPVTGKKRAHWFSLPSRPVFAFAGIWRIVGDQPHYAFLTTEPNALVGGIHPKAMPVILEENEYDRWLTAPWDEARGLVGAYPSQLMAVSDTMKGA